MEKNKKIYQNSKNKNIELPLERIPQFGTICQEVNNTKFFVPLSPNEKQRAELTNCFILMENYYDRKETFYIYMKTKNESEIELRHRNIKKVRTQSTIKQDGSIEQILYFHLANPPKIFRKINKRGVVKAEDNYIQKFSKITDDFDFTNHYHLEYNRLNKFGRNTIIKENSVVEHFKNQKLNNDTKNESINEEIEFDFVNDSEYMNYIRIDSYLALKPEFFNFYLLNLVMKIKIKFLSQAEANDFIKELKLGLITKEKATLHSIPNKEINEEIDNYLKRKVKSFYKILLNFHFNLQYSILCLITQKRLNIFSFDMELFKILEKMDCEQQNNASLIIEHMIKEQNIKSKCKLVEIFNNFLSQSFKNEFLVTDDKEKQNKDIMKTRTVEVTPSMIFYKPPIYEKINHILRKYMEYKDNFIKVNFVDEENNKIFFSSQSLWIMINFLKNTMLDGILVGSRNFEFLSASNSQMKNSSYWFFCLEGTRFIEVEQIIRELGDFTKETNIHKNAARRGQCLSTTSYIKKVNISSIKQIPDIERNGFCFTDGIGMISTDLAIECAKSFKQDYASAFQIRIGGIKGIIAVNPDIKEKEAIWVRPSMTKFDSLDTELGVIRCSNFSQGYLNRQIIILLSTLGVSNQIFFDMLDKDLDIYQKLIETPALIFSKQINSGDLLKKCYFFMPTLSYFCNNNFNIKNEPFVYSLILNLSIAKIMDLKNKGKIIDKFSAVLLGVIDETETLQEGEVYIQIKKENYCKNNQKECFVLDTDIIVTKNPCLHPGDIKVLKAMSGEKYNQKLDHMVNVIVFSSKGKRPIQNEIGGGDLDGDSYYVSWNENMVNNIKMKNVRPMNETKGMTSSIKKKDIKMKDIVNSYIEYMKNDTIAIISNVHLAFADADTERMAYSPNCLKLAELFSIAIDAPKHGNFVTHEQFKNLGFNKKEYPDFLEIPSFPSYKSQGVLGQLYRRIDVAKYLKEYEYNEYKFYYLEDYCLEMDFVSDSSSKFCIDAYQIYVQYQNEIKSLMMNHKVFYETEFFLSENLHDKKRNKQFKQNDVYTELNNIKEKYSKIIMNTFQSNNKDICFDVASAFYVVTYLNDKSLEKFNDFFYPKFKDLINAMTKDGRLNNNFENNYNYEDYKYYTDSMDFKALNQIVKKKRIFSLPWFIKEVREKLFRKKNNY